jgi:CRP-like cAMP-binding protein
VARALWWATLVDEAVAREWIVNIGQRTALERTAHLFCELFHRLQAVELTRDTRCELPMTQTELGEAMGLSAVHVNRTLQELRREGLITLEDRELKILDLPRLEAVAMFDPAYLHLQGPYGDHEHASGAAG